MKQYFKTPQRDIHCASSISTESTEENIFFRDVHRTQEALGKDEVKTNRYRRNITREASPCSNNKAHLRIII